MNKKAKITVEETVNTFRVLGPYNEMKNVYPKLKSKKFKYDGSDRAWYIDKSKFNGTIKELEELIKQLESNATDIQEEQNKQDVQKRNDFVNKCKSFQYIKIVPDGLYGINVYAPYGYFGTDFYKLKGRWNSGKFVFDRVPDKLYEMLKEYEDFVDKKVSEAKKYNGISIGSKPYLITLKVDKNIMEVSSSNRELRDVIKNAFPHAKWKDNVWKVEVTDIKNMDNAISSFKEKCDDLNKKLLEKQVNEEQRKKDGYMDIQYCTAWDGLNMRNFYVGQVVKNKWNKTPEYLKVTKIKFRGKYEGDDYFFIVSYAPLSDEELKDYLGEKEKEIKSSDAKRRIQEIINIIQKRGNRPNELKPSGDKYINDWSKRLSVYGGGEWIYIDGNKIIYVMNHGSDGDDWSANNVSTGGAGGMGWILQDASLAKELIPLFQVAGWKKD